jgi:hypothetical protein
MLMNEDTEAEMYIGSFYEAKGYMIGKAADEWHNKYSKKIKINLEELNNRY